MNDGVVIIGAGHGGAQMVTHLRQHGYDGKITICGDEPYAPYHRPPLSKSFLAGEIPMERLYIKPPKFFQDQAVLLHLDQRVIAIDPDEKTIQLQDDAVVRWDHLILATGSHARRLEIPGHDLDHIFYLRTMGDVLKIRQQFERAREILVVGAGYIGLEVAAVARKHHKNVTVLEAGERVLNRVVAPAMSAFYQQVHEEEGVHLHLNTEVESFAGTAGRVTHVVTRDGRKMAADMIIIGVGATPADELARAVGIACDNGVMVDEYCRTGVADIYAVGDCASHPNPLYERRIRLESVPNANGQAKTAARTIVGRPAPYDELPWFWSDQYDMKLQIAGLSEGFDEVVYRGDQRQRSFTAFYLKNKILIAADAVNSPREFMASKIMIQQCAAPDLKRLADPTLSMKEFMS